ncbi:hypothetical protein ZHAS_00005718 [Anopheles sinensis]|uniref:Uncharacterized protein n=1 Tax=Anopheles sinensis TaxID=74873 RepID=A0A084VK69_ANOSI|nr:hypothetical protein ZHAS_00005718 [Anopheles sinensis]
MTYQEVGSADARSPASKIVHEKSILGAKIRPAQVTGAQIAREDTTAGPARAREEQHPSETASPK